jgi:hypothetical protein
MKFIHVAKRLLGRRSILLHAVLLLAALIGLLAWLLGSNEKWLALCFASVAVAILLLGIQLQVSVDSIHTLKNNSQRRHAALKIINDRFASQAEKLAAGSNGRIDAVGGQLKSVSTDLARIGASLQESNNAHLFGALQADLTAVASGNQILSDQLRFRFAELIDLYQDQSDRQRAFELRLNRVLQEAVDSIVESSLETELPEEEILNDVDSVPDVEPSQELPTSGRLDVEALIESVWPSVQNHIWLRDLYARSGSIAPRDFLASPENMKAGVLLGASRRLLIDWGIDSLTFQLADERSRLGMTTVAVESNERLADLAAQAMGGNLRTVSTATLATHELGYELAGLIDEPAGVIVGRQLEDKELERFAAVLDALNLVECVYVTSAVTGGGSTAEVLAGAGFALSEQDETSEVDKAGLELWERIT